MKRSTKKPATKKAATKRTAPARTPARTAPVPIETPAERQAPAVDISERAILVSLSISSWTARKYDRRVTQETNQREGASDDAGRFNKSLLPGDALSYKALTSHLSALRAKHYDQTLVWSDNGDRLLPIDNRRAYMDMVTDGKATADTLLDEFVDAYPAMRETARVKLGAMYKDEDYPSVAALRGKFTIVAEFSPVPNGDFGRVPLSRSELAEMEQQVQSRVQRGIQAAMGDAWQRLYTVIESMHERLSDPKAVFRDTLVTNVQECCSILARLNVTGDADLERLRLATQDKLLRLDAETLRDSSLRRSVVAQSAGAIMAQIRGIRRIAVTPKAA